MFFHFVVPFLMILFFDRDPDEADGLAVLIHDGDQPVFFADADGSVRAVAQRREFVGREERALRGAVKPGHEREGPVVAAFADGRREVLSPSATSRSTLVRTSREPARRPRPARSDISHE